MEVILLQDVAKLGDKDDVVKVKPGFANNYLIPRGMAVMATASTKKVLAENLRQAAHRQEKIKAEAQQLAQKLSNLTLTVPTLAGKEGKIYGSITPLQIANLLKEQGYDVDRRKITFETEIRVLGEYKARVNLHKEIKAEVALQVVEKAG
ncbi:MAG: 50S ribosomal protein L9 [Bacteroidetes bacterium]|nr:50S ribosomal protein L9 [Bacteroidota bacterium]